MTDHEITPFAYTLRRLFSAVAAAARADFSEEEESRNSGSPALEVADTIGDLIDAKEFGELTPNVERALSRCKAQARAICWAHEQEAEQEDVAASQFNDDIGIRWAPAHSHFHKLFEIMFVTGRRRRDHRVIVLETPFRALRPAARSHDAVRRGASVFKCRSSFCPADHRHCSDAPRTSYRASVNRLAPPSWPRTSRGRGHPSGIALPASRPVHSTE
jgi:hypothetical protein